MWVLVVCVVLLFVFFFQAEDGIRDYKVTGVQTCALPIWLETTCRRLLISSESLFARSDASPALLMAFCALFWAVMACSFAALMPLWAFSSTPMMLAVRSVRVCWICWPFLLVWSPT